MNTVFSNMLVPSVRFLGCLTLGWLSLSGGILAPAAIAQPHLSKSKPQSIVFTPPKPPKPQGAPSGRVRGGASRGACKDYEGLTALVPVQNNVVRGLTSSPKPTLWFYLPAPVNADLKAEFVLQNRSSKSSDFVYQTPLTFDTDSPGIVQVAVKTPEPALEADNHYQWTLALYCDPSRPSASVYVTGLLEPVAAKASAPGLSPFEQAAQDAQDGIWFDSLTALGELRQAAPNNPKFEQAWMELLQQIDLGDLAPAPLI